MIRKRPRHLEDAEAMALMAWARITPFRGRHVADFLIHIPNGGKRNAREAARLKRMGVRAGVPDYFLHLVLKDPNNPARVFGGLWIELKATADSGISDKQVEQLDWLFSCNYMTARADGWTKAARLICEYLGIKCNVPCSSPP